MVATHGIDWVTQLAALRAQLRPAIQELCSKPETTRKNAQAHRGRTKGPNGQHRGEIKVIKDTAKAKAGEDPPPRVLNSSQRSQPVEHPLSRPAPPWPQNYYAMQTWEQVCSPKHARPLGGNGPKGQPSFSGAGPPGSNDGQLETGWRLTSTPSPHPSTNGFPSLRKTLSSSFSQSSNPSSREVTLSPTKALPKPRSWQTSL